MSDQSNPNVAEFFSPGPGERLRAARLSMGYDLAKIAGELHLTVNVVEALEADDFKDVGARVFVRGYLRNYARVVGVPVESVLRQFDEKWPDDGASHSMVRESPTLPADGGPGRGWAGAITWLMVLGLVVLFLMWWRGYLDEIVPEQIRSTTVVDGLESIGLQGDDPSPVLLDGIDMSQEGGLALPAPIMQEAPTDLAPGSVPGEAAPTPDAASDLISVPPAPEAEQGASAAETASAVPAMEPGNSATAPAAVLGTEAATNGDGGAPVIDGTQQIVLSFSGASWVDVRDSERKFKLFGEIPKGSRKVLGGEPPYKLVIGNAEAVKITVNGEPFDITPYAKGNVARFTLDP